MGRLVSSDQEHIAVTVHIGNNTFRFQESMLSPRCLKVMGNNVCCMFDGFLSIAATDMFVSLYIGGFLIIY